MHVATHTIHIFIEISKTEKKRIEFDIDQVSGRQIKEKAGIPFENDLARREHGQLVLVTNDQIITIKNGEHFVDLPPGTIS